jgi:hypothetical protein
MILTIFGSCRQQCISRYLNTTQIQEQVNYPHYTKEILQQIHYLKKNNIPMDMTRWCFRTGLLTGQPINNYIELKTQFDNTTLFLIEIASRIEYKWNNIYLHHIAEDPQYGFHDREHIERRISTDEEIEEDILQIKKELYPKPFIIISHFATYENGSRYELTLLLKRICEKWEIPFLNQSDIVKTHGIDIIVKEPVLSHYTQEGQEIVSNILLHNIREVVSTNRQTLYQVYYTSEERVKQYTFHGFGDYLRGTIYLYQLCKKNNVQLKVNFSNHLLKNCFLCDNTLSIEECEKARYIFGHDADIFSNLHIFTNCYPITEIDDECKEFIKTNCLTPTPAFLTKVRDQKRILDITNYSVIHIRIDDNQVFISERQDAIKNIIEQIVKENENETYVLIASNDMYTKNESKLPNVIIPNLERGHVGLHTISQKQCEDTMIEFMFMTTCNKIYQLSSYGWGSGFSDIVSNLYNVDITHIKL